MKIETFRKLAEIHGGDLSRWPAPQQSAAAALLRGDPAAAVIIEEALEVDRWLSMADVVVDDARVDQVIAALDARIAADGSRPPATAGRSPPRRGFGSAWAAGFLVGMGMLGMLVGVLIPVTAASVGSSVATVSEAPVTLTSLTEAAGHYSARYFVDGRR